MTSGRSPKACPVAVHDILVAWQAGRMSARHAMALTGVDGLDTLYRAARESGVPSRKTLLPQEKRAADCATAAVCKRLAAATPDLEG